MSNQNHDTIERKHVEEALRESKEIYHSLFEDSKDGLYIATREGKFVDINQASVDMFGYTRDEALSTLNVLDLYANPADRIKFQQEIEEKGAVRDYEMRLRKKDGTEIDCLVTSTAWRDDDGRILGYKGIVRDITERKQMEEKIRQYTENLEKLVEERTKALKESEEKFRATLTGIGDIITIQNKDFDIIWVNQTVRDIWGDVIGKKCHTTYKKLPAPCPGCSVEKVFEEGKTIVYESLTSRPDGRNIHTLVTSSPVRDAEGNTVAVVEVAKDITERKKLEWQLKDYTENLEKLIEERTKSLRESEKRYRTLFEDSRDAIYIRTRDGNLIDINQATVDLFGYTRDELLMLNNLELYVNPDDRVKFQQEIERKGSVKDYELQLCKKDRTEIDCLVTSTVRRASDGSILGYQGIVRDITERKELERKLKDYTENLEELVEERTLELKESEFRYRSLFEDSRDMIFITTREGKLIDVNQAGLELFGYTRNELMSLNVMELYAHPADRVNFQKEIEQRGSVKDYELQFRKKDGTEMDCLLTTTVWRADDGRILGYQGIVRDITQQKREEEKTKRYTKDLERIVDERTGDLKEVQRLLYNIYYKMS